jgi:hypothetical protein
MLLMSHKNMVQYFWAMNFDISSKLLRIFFRDTDPNASRLTEKGNNIIGNHYSPIRTANICKRRVAIIKERRRRDKVAARRGTHTHIENQRNRVFINRFAKTAAQREEFNLVRAVMSILILRHSALGTRRQLRSNNINSSVEQCLWFWSYRN